MRTYIDEVECSCGGYVAECCGIDLDGDEDEIIRTVRGKCTECGKEYIYKERYALLGFYDIKEK